MGGGDLLSLNSDFEFAVPGGSSCLTTAALLDTNPFSPLSAREDENEFDVQRPRQDYYNLWRAEVSPHRDMDLSDLEQSSMMASSFPFDSSEAFGEEAHKEAHDESDRTYMQDQFLHPPFFRPLPR